MKYGWWRYGLILGLCLLFFQVLRSKVFIHSISLEMYGGIVAVIFLMVGMFLSRRIFDPTNHQKVVSISNLDDCKLSGREKEVLELLGQGYSNQEIADRLYVSLNTVKTHLTRIYGKLGVNSRTQAMKKVILLQESVNLPQD